MRFFVLPIFRSKDGWMDCPKSSHPSRAWRFKIGAKVVFLLLNMIQSCVDSWWSLSYWQRHFYSILATRDYWWMAGVLRVKKGQKIGWMVRNFPPMSCYQDESFYFALGFDKKPFSILNTLSILWKKLKYSMTNMDLLWLVSINIKIIDLDF